MLSYYKILWWSDRVIVLFVDYNRKDYNRINSYLNALYVMTKEKKMSNRIRLMVQDICDLSNLWWKPRHELNISLKVEQKDAIVPSKKETSLPLSSDDEPVAHCS